MVQSYGLVKVTGLQEAIESGKKYARAHPAVGNEAARFVSQGNVMGKVCRLVSAEAVPLYENDRAGAYISEWVKPGAWIVVFDDLGTSPMRQVNTAKEKYGYIDRKVKLEPVKGVLPQELYDPGTRAAAEAAVARRSAVAAENRAGGLSRAELGMALVFGAALLVAVTVALIAR